MKKNVSRYYMILLLMYSTVFATAQNAGRDEQSIRESRDASNEAIRKYDYDGIAKHFTKNVTVIAASGQTLTGKDPVLKLMKSRFEQTPGLFYRRSPDHVIIAASDTIAWENGRWTTHGIHPAPRGNYAATWCKRHGVWLIRSELFVGLN
jgi:ketosteroid isomerase-like protein